MSIHSERSGYGDERSYRGSRVLPARRRLAARRQRALRAAFSLLLMGGTLTAVSCGQMVRQSMRDGLFSYVSGNFRDRLDLTGLSDVILDFLNGAFLPGLSTGTGSSAPLI